MRKAGIFLSILLPIAIGMDIYQIFFAGMTLFPPLSREILWLMVLILLLWFPFHDFFFSRLDLIQKLRVVAGFLIIIYGGSRLYHYFDVPFDEGVFGMNDFFTGMGLPLLILFVILWLFLIIKSLIFIQRSKNTELNFQILIVLMIGHAVYHLIYKSDLYYDYGRPFGGFETWNSLRLFDFFVIAFSIINGTRCKWIHYLKKHQKTAVFLIGSLLFGLSLMSFQQLPLLTRGYSQTVTIFLKDFFLFYSVYIGMSLLCVLIQLPAAGLLDKRREELKSLQSLSAAIRSVLDKKELIHNTTSLCVDLVKADLSWMDLYDKKSAGHFVGMKGAFVAEMLALSEADRTALRNNVLSQGQCVLWNNMRRDKKNIGMEKWPKKSGSLLAAPLKDKNKTFGVLYAYHEENYGFTEESRGMLQSFADQAAVALSNVNLVALTLEQELYKEELRVAHDAQMRLLPESLPNIPGAEISGFCLTANDIGGDFYDVIAIGDNRIDIVIGDVSGKGASAAFYMAELKGMIQMLASNFVSPKRILLEMNRYLYQHFEPHTFVTMIYAVYIPSKKQAKIVRAGHNPAVLFGKRTAEWLNMPGLGLGLVNNEILEKQLVEKIIELNNEEGLFLYTDGLVEARNQEGEEFGEEKLTLLLEQVEDETVQQIREIVRNQMQRFSGDAPRIDDITMVVLRLKEN